MFPAISGTQPVPGARRTISACASPSGSPEPVRVGPQPLDDSADGVLEGGGETAGPEQARVSRGTHVHGENLDELETALAAEGGQPLAIHVHVVRHAHGLPYER